MTDTRQIIAGRNGISLPVLRLYICLDDICGNFASCIDFADILWGEHLNIGIFYIFCNMRDIVLANILWFPIEGCSSGSKEVALTSAEAILWGWRMSSSFRNKASRASSRFIINHSLNGGQ